MDSKDIKTKMADDFTQKICNAVKQDAQVKTARKYVNFEAIAYRSQVLSGTNYIIKVNVGGSDYIHLAVCVTEFLVRAVPQCVYTLGGVLQGKTLDDPIE